MIAARQSIASGGSSRRRVGPLRAASIGVVRERRDVRSPRRAPMPFDLMLAGKWPTEVKA